MTVPESEIAALVRAVVPDRPLDREQIADRYARARWSAIAEPGDADAGRLLAAVGAMAALELLSAGAPALADAAGGSFTEAVERWSPRLRQVDTPLHLRQAARFGARLLVPGDAEWPTGLDDLGMHAPSALWVRGDATLLGRLERSIAIVGARAATGYGEHVTVEVASGLVDRGFAIVSGAAFGIDGAAHRAALASGGSTVAFLAGGVDRFYPSAHETLLTRIVDRGAVVSEVPCGTAPTKWRFLQRNRLIAAASSATVVVEAGWRSGSLNTAGHAAQLGRPLGAVPGPVTSSASAGCHRLIREYDAVCVTTAQEMAELVDPTGAPTLLTGDPSPERTRVLDALTRTGRDLSRIAAISGMSLDAVRAELGMLELDGLATEGPSGWRRGSG
ncbi:DNA-processing protein DprA [Pseudolysinimonas sp.]|jgi:DNA processing protein|uniref:DNA-processing protein DprA n=1 Tax=Pseudolysinimonas sp. TaxID=2680009 RepID=UPI0037830326